MANDLIAQARRYLATYPYDPEEGLCFRELVTAHEQALTALAGIAAVRPDNWDDEGDAEQAAAWRSVQAALPAA